jgi:hypothetical protein
MTSFSCCVLRVVFLCAGGGAFLGLPLAKAGDEKVSGRKEPVTLWLMKDVVFYDGYAKTVAEPVPEGVLRHSNSLHAVRLTDEQLDAIQNTLKIGVVVGALCDNYDRLGSVHLALAPKGAGAYVSGQVDRIEVARFITPFMNRHVEPTQVSYEFEANGVAAILKSRSLRERHDLWFELKIFGVPYAAQKEIPGCEGRIDTQLGSLWLQTDSSQEAEVFDVLMPLALGESFNNYAEGASDELGETRKTVEFELEEDADYVQFVLITSNHGANAGGEEYNRREHFVFIDEFLELVYLPGRDSCEPFRKYNTQGNGIYGPTPRSNDDWQSFSNWCPGDVIETRIIPWEAVNSGPHQFVIEVPDAVFVDGQGDIPFSLYLQAR